jgi:hypothetical protein
MLRVVVLEGHRLADAGDLKSARAKYREAQQWELEVQRVEAAMLQQRRQRTRYTSSRGPKRP